MRENMFKETTSLFLHWKTFFFASNPSSTIHSHWWSDPPADLRTFLKILYHSLTHLFLLQADIEDDERMFDQSELTSREKLERVYKKNVYKLASGLEEVTHEEHVQRYIVPSDKEKFIDTFEDEEDKVIASGGGVSEQRR